MKTTENLKRELVELNLNKIRGRRVLSESQCGKWVVGAALLVLGFITVIVGISYAINLHPMYGLLIPIGVYLDYVIIDDQVFRNWRLRHIKNQNRT